MKPLEQGACYILAFLLIASINWIFQIDLNALSIILTGVSTYIIGNMIYQNNNYNNLHFN